MCGVLLCREEMGAQQCGGCVQYEVPSMKTKLPEAAKRAVQAYVDAVSRILGPKLYGIYMYGAAVFPDAGPLMDIDCHVILNEPLRDAEREAVVEMRGRIFGQYPPPAGDIDGWYILLDAAKGTSWPQHQLDRTMFDTSWSLHCAHIRAGRYERLWGPEPTEIFPDPSWEALDADLEQELNYVKEHPEHPAYCVLNLCRIMYSYSQRDVVVSKRYSGKWGVKQFPRWRPLIEAAMRYYAETRYYSEEANPEDDALLEGQLKAFLAFSLDYIDRFRHLPSPGPTSQ